MRSKKQPKSKVALIGTGEVLEFLFQPVSEKEKKQMAKKGTAWVDTKFCATLIDVYSRIILSEANKAWIFSDSRFAMLDLVDVVLRCHIEPANILCMCKDETDEVVQKLDGLGIKYYLKGQIDFAKLLS